jgi:metallo-beta-lactamase class B
MENAPAGKKNPAVVLPKHDQVVREDQPVMLGDFKVIPVAIPGHTGGSMGYIFTVKDNGKNLMAATYGGNILTPATISDENLQIYLKSIAHFKEETKKAKVEIVLQNHPLMYDEPKLLAEVQSRKKGQPNPFVVERANQQKFFDVMSTCIEVAVARRKL